MTEDEADEIIPRAVVELYRVTGRAEVLAHWIATYVETERPGALVEEVDTMPGAIGIRFQRIGVG